MMERLIPNKMTGSMANEYFKDLKENVEYITNKGAYAMIVPHNYGRYYNKIITNPSDFEAWWKTAAGPFKSNSKVIFDTNNEYHDMDQQLVVRLNQAAINGIRTAGAVNQIINVEGNAWTGAWTWVSDSQNGATMQNLKDPQNKIQYQMHQYLDKDGSGKHTECVSVSIGEDRLKAVTAWLKQHKKTAILGEFAGGDNPMCKAAVRRMLAYMQANTDVWKGWLWWSAGQWWFQEDINKDYIFSMEPTRPGTSYRPYIDLIMQYA
jgi:endoglucanase